MFDLRDATLVNQGAVTFLRQLRGRRHQARELSRLYPGVDRLEPVGWISGGGKGAGIGSVIGGAGGLGTTAFRGRQKITLSSGQEMLIRITGR